MFVAIPAFAAVGNHLGRSYPHRPVMHDAVIGALSLYGLGCLLVLACCIWLVDPYLLPLWNASPSNAMRWAVEAIPGLAISYAGHRFLLMLLARKVSADELAAVQATWSSMQDRDI